VDDLDHVLLQSTDAGGGLPRARGQQRVRAGRDALEVEPHTPPHAAQTASARRRPPVGQQVADRLFGPVRLHDLPGHMGRRGDVVDREVRVGISCLARGSSLDAPVGRAAHAATRGRSEARWHGGGQQAGYRPCGRDKPNVGLALYSRRVPALLQALLDRAGARDPTGDLDHVLLQGCDAGDGLPGARGATARQDRDAPEDEPHTPPHAAQTALGGTNPPEREQSPPLRACGRTSGQWSIWPGPAARPGGFLSRASRGMRLARPVGSVRRSLRRFRRSNTLALRPQLAHTGLLVPGRAAWLALAP
jgi:hypothetical protein